MSCDSSTFSGECVECRGVEADRKPSSPRRARAATRATSASRRDALALGLQHDRRAVRVVGAHEVDLVPLHPLEAHPDVGLDVLHDVADVERSVRVRQRRGDEQLARQRATTSARPCKAQGEAIDSSKKAARHGGNRIRARIPKAHPSTHAHDRSRRHSAPQDRHRSQHRTRFRGRQGGQEGHRRRATTSRVDLALGYPAKSQHESLRKLVHGAVGALPGVGAGQREHRPRRSSRTRCSAA